MKTESKPKICIFCENEIQLNWVNCPNCGFDLSSWNTFEKNVETYRDFMLELNFDLSTLKETLKINITNPSTGIIKIFEAIKKLEESKIEIGDPILKSKYILLKTIRNQCAHGEKDFKDIKMVGVALDVLDLLLQECYGLISNYNKQISVFVPPKNWNQMLERINATNLIGISGDPFSGKTTTLYNIARVLSDKGYKIENNVENVKELFSVKKDSKKPTTFSEKSNQKYVFILDDIFGDTQFDPSLGNFWSKKLIMILNNPQYTSKFLVGTRKNILDEFYRTNDELQIHGKLNDFKKCVFELGITSYDENDLVEILKNNASFIKLDEMKMALLLKKVDMITQKLLLPGSIYNVLEEVQNTNNFDENSLNRILSENNSGVIFSNRIKPLKDYEKIFLFNLFINQNFNIDDLEAIYFQCLPSDLTERDYFEDCIKKFENNFIKTKIELELLSDKKIKKLEFVHHIYIEAIEKIINSDEIECKRLEDILNRLYNLVKNRSISDWKSKDSNYKLVKFNIYKIALRYYTIFNIQIKDLVFEIIESLSFGLEIPTPAQVVYDPEMDMPENWDEESSKFLMELFNNHDKFVEETYYFNELFKKEEYKVNIAYCFAYRLDPKIIKKLQNNLKNLSTGNEEVKHLLAKCIIKNYESLDEDNRKLLYTLGIKSTLLIQFLMHNYSILSKELKDTLEKQIAIADTSELIETFKIFLLNYSFLPNEIRRHYDFAFCLKDELVIKQVGKTFVAWFEGTFSDLNYDPKRENIDEKVLELYCNWLKNKEIILENYKEIRDLYDDLGLIGIIEYSISYSNSLNLKKPKWYNPLYSKLKDALEANMIILLKSFNFPSIEDKAKSYITAFNFYSLSRNGELIEVVNKILSEIEEIKLSFLYEMNFDNISQEKETKYPFKITFSQKEIIEKLSKDPNNPRVRSAANEVLDYIKKSIDNHTMEIAQDDFS
jgi:hypothetical protein